MAAHTVIMHAAGRLGQFFESGTTQIEWRQTPFQKTGPVCRCWQGGNFPKKNGQVPKLQEIHEPNVHQTKLYHSNTLEFALLVLKELKII